MLNQPKRRPRPQLHQLRASPRMRHHHHKPTAKVMTRIDSRQQKGAEVRAAIADYKRRFIAKHGQAEWDKEFMARPGRSRTVLPDLLAQHHDNVCTRSPRQALAPGTHVSDTPSVSDTCV